MTLVFWAPNPSLSNGFKLSGIYFKFHELDFPNTASNQYGRKSIVRHIQSRENILPL